MLQTITGTSPFQEHLLIVNCYRIPSPRNTYQVDSSFKIALSVKIITSSGRSLDLDPLNFIWQNAYLSAAQSTFKNGQKGAIAELYGWPWVDVGRECEFLGKAGYMGVKVWPPNEHVWTSDKVSGYSSIQSVIPLTPTSTR